MGHICARLLRHWGHQVTVFADNAFLRDCFQGSAIEVSGDMTRLSEFNVLAEVTGDPSALDRVLRLSAPGATILLLGSPPGATQTTSESAAANDKTVVESAGSGAKEYAEAIKLLPQLDLEALVRCVLPLDRFREGWDYLREGKQLKVLLEVDTQL